MCNSTCFDIDRSARWALNVTARSESGWLSGVLLSRERAPQPRPSSRYSVPRASPLDATCPAPPTLPPAPPSLSSDVCEWMLSSSSQSSSSKPPAEGREVQMEVRLQREFSLHPRTAMAGAAIPVATTCRPPLPILMWREDPQFASPRGERKHIRTGFLSRRLFSQINACVNFSIESRKDMCTWPP